MIGRERRGAKGRKRRGKERGKRGREREIDGIRVRNQVYGETVPKLT